MTAEWAGNATGQVAGAARVAVGLRIAGGIVIGLLAALMTVLVASTAPDALRIQNGFWSYVFSVVFVAMMAVYAGCAWVGVVAMVRPGVTLLLIALWGTAIPLVLPFGTGIVALVYEAVNGWQGPNPAFASIFIFAAAVFTPVPVLAALALRQARRPAVS